MSGPAHKLGCQKRKEKKKRELTRALDPNNNVITFSQSAQKAAPSQVEEASDSQVANVTANVTSVGEGATTTCKKEDDVDNSECVCVCARAYVAPSTE